jgi:hypothetical protein
MVSFERRFSLMGPVGGVLHVFADTRYRLWVNGDFVAYGPGRFVTSQPEYDTHDLRGHLRAGENLVRVEVNYYGASSYQTMPDGLPGFIAAGGTEEEGVDFATPGDWRARVHEAWEAQAPLFSFAQNPVEICDTRLLARELAEPATGTVAALPPSACPWKVLVPRSVPLPDYREVRPGRLLVSGPLEDSLRWGLQVRHPQFLPGDRKFHQAFILFSTWIHSPREQKVSMDCFWSDLSLNGHPQIVRYPQRLGNHGETTVDLAAGWNFLAGNFEVLLEHWSYLLGFARSSGVSLHALPDLSCADVFAVSPPVKDRSVPHYTEDPAEYSLPEGWTLDPGAVERVTPARQVGWDQPAPATAVRDIPWSGPLSLGTQHARAALWSFDFQDEYYGHTVLEVEAPEGSVLDVAYDDWKREDGCVRLYGSNPFTDAADRFILRGGRQRVEVLNPRGGIFLQVILRAPAGSGAVPLRVHDVAVRRRTVLHDVRGSFTSGDVLLDWAWRVSVHTLQASTDEAYADCPWRERGSYIGDSLVNFHLHQLITSDLRVARRTFDHFGQAQLENGQLACCAPSWLRRPHEDFTLIWILAVRDFWAATGDVAFLREQWPVIERIWASTGWKADADGLWDTTGCRMFIDWGVLSSEREGAGNAVVNLFRVAAARASGEIAAALGREADARHHRDEAQRVAEALRTRVWREEEGRFNASIGAETPAVHANILALRFGVGPADRILAYLEPKLRANFKFGLEHGQSTGFAELYFFSYLLPALAELGRPDLAELLIEEHYSFIQKLGYPTLTECFHRAHEHSGSCCHSWSGAPAIYATAYVLGLRAIEPGNPDRWKLAPVVNRHRHAEGEVPHPRGVIRVRWERHNGTFEAHVETPEGVVVEPGPGVVIASRQD